MVDLIKGLSPGNPLSGDESLRLVQDENTVQVPYRELIASWIASRNGQLEIHEYIKGLEVNTSQFLVRFENNIYFPAEGAPPFITGFAFEDEKWAIVDSSKDWDLADEVETISSLVQQNDARIDAIEQDIDVLQQGQQSNQITFSGPTGWTTLQARSAASVGQSAQVINDPGTHTDPVSALSVPNTGQYAATGTAWQWIRADVIASKADKSELAATQKKADYALIKAESDWGAANGSSLPGIARLLFARGSYGTYIDPADLNGVFTASDGVIPDGAPGLKIGKILDKSGRGFDAKQEVDASKPTLSTRKNLLIRTQQLDSGVWPRVDCTAVANVGIGADGTQTTDKIVEGSANGSHNIQQVYVAPAGYVTCSSFFRASGRNWALLIPTTSAQAAVWFDLANGVVGTMQASVLDAKIENYGNGLYRCSVVFSRASAGSDIFAIRPATANGITSYQGDGASGIESWGMQSESGYGVSKYQAVSDDTTFDAVGYEPRINYAAGQSLVIQFPRSLGQNCTVIRGVRGVGAVIQSGQSIGATFTDSTNSEGLIVLDRSLSAYELDVVSKYFSERLNTRVPGSSDPGYFVRDLTVSGVNARVTTSDGYGSGDPDTLMILCHGNGKNYTYGPNAAFRAWARANKVSFACISQQEGGTTGWGNDVARNRIENLYNRLMSDYRFHKSVVLVGDSMGGLVMGQLAYYKPFPIRFCLGIGPVPSLEYIFNNAPARKSAIRSAYGMASDGSMDGQLSAYISGYDWFAMGNSSDSQPRKVGFPRMHIYAGSGDSTYVTDFGGDTNYPIIRDALRRAGSFCALTIVPALIHDDDALWSNVLADGVMAKEIG